MRRTPVVLTIGASVVVLLLLGPAIAPHAIDQHVGPPFSPPGTGGLLGTDHLGRDVVSLLLLGGRAMLLTSLVAALCGSLVGTTVGLFTALAAPGRRWVDPVLLRPLDALAAVPPLLVVLLILVAVPGRGGLVLAVVLSTAPLSARVIRAAAAGHVGRAHLEVALARGEGWAWLLCRELAPLVAGTVLADVGVRFVAAVYLVAAAGFLGLDPSDSDWGLMIAEALPGAPLAPWALLAPVLGVAVLTVGVNLLVDRVGHRARSLAA